jgi:hypothetical protein
MNEGVILDKWPGPHKDNGEELNKGNKAKEHFLESILTFLIKDIIGELHDNGIVDKVQEKEVQDDGAADLLAGFFNGFVFCAFPDERVEADPWENLVDLSHVATVVDELSAAQKHYNDRGRSNDRAINVQRCGEGDDNVVQETLENAQSLIEPLQRRRKRRIHRNRLGADERRLRGQGEDLVRVVDKLIGQ